jgi:hypothetical protein
MMTSTSAMMDLTWRRWRLGRGPSSHRTSRRRRPMMMLVPARKPRRRSSGRAQPLRPTGADGVTEEAGCRLFAEERQRLLKDAAEHRYLSASIRREQQRAAVICCSHYTLCLMQLSVVRNLILPGSSNDFPRVDY